MKIKYAGLLTTGLVLAACGSAASPNSSTFPTTAPTHNVISSVTSIKSKYGRILASKTGMTYYMFLPDSTGKSVCYSSCAAVWPPVTTASPNIPVSGGVKKSLISTFARKGGTLQIQYDGHPLYTYEGDTAPKLTNGEGVNSYGGYWYVMSVSGKPIEASYSAPAANSGSSSTPSTTSGSSSAPY